MESRDILSFHDIDKLLASLGVIFSIVLIVYLWLNFGRLIYVLTGILVLISCSIWLFIRKKASLSNLEFQSPRVYLMLNIFFFLLLTSSIIFLYLRPSYYERPLVYFVLILLMSGIVVLEILFLPKKKRYFFLILFQIIIIGLNLGWSQELIFPNIVGMDPWWHQMFTSKILDSSHIPEGYIYSKLPSMHLTVGATSLITDLNYKMATMLSIGLFQVLCNVMFIFLLGRFLINEKVGLLAGLLLVTANHHLSMGFWTTPTTIAAVLIPIVLYLLFKLRKEEKIISISLAVIFMIVLILTHTITAMCMAIVLFIGWAASKAYNKIYCKHAKTLVTLPIITFFTVSMFAWWTYASGHITALVRLIQWGFSADFFLQGYGEVIEYIATIPLSEQLFNQLGMFLFFAISFIGCFYMLSKKGTSHTFIMAVVGITPLAIGFFSLITGHSVIEHRWWYFSQILLALPLAIAFFLLSEIIKSKYAKAFFLSIFTIFLAFFMIMSSIANLDNHNFSPNSRVRFALVESELQSIETTSELWNKTIGGDLYYADGAATLGYNTTSICEQLYIKNFTKSDDVLLSIREEIITKPFWLFTTIYKLDYDPKQMLMEQKYSRVYDCRSVTVYLFI